MPFKSKAQVRKFAELVKQGEMSQAKFDEWAKATPSMDKLPERIGPAKKKPNSAVRPFTSFVEVAARKRK